MSTIDLDAIRARADELNDGWTCGKCGESSYAHSVSTSTCVWEPIDANPIGEMLRALVAEVERMEAVIERVRQWNRAAGSVKYPWLEEIIGRLEPRTSDSSSTRSEL